MKKVIFFFYCCICISCSSNVKHDVENYKTESHMPENDSVPTIESDKKWSVTCVFDKKINGYNVTADLTWEEHDWKYDLGTLAKITLRKDGHEYIVETHLNVKPFAIQDLSEEDEEKLDVDSVIANLFKNDTIVLPSDGMNINAHISRTHEIPLGENGTRLFWFADIDFDGNNELLFPYNGENTSNDMIMHWFHIFKFNGKQFIESSFPCDISTTRIFFFPNKKSIVTSYHGDFYQLWEQKPKSKDFYLRREIEGVARADTMIIKDYNAQESLVREKIILNNKWREWYYEPTSDFFKQIIWCSNINLL